MASRPYAATFQIAHLSDHALASMLDALFSIDCEQVANPKLPLIYFSGVKYFDPGNRDDPWCDAYSTYHAGEGDCEDLACWRAAELRVRFGIAATPCFVRRTYPDGKQKIHIFVKLPGGRYEDPSRILGMTRGGA